MNKNIIDAASLEQASRTALAKGNISDAEQSALQLLAQYPESSTAHYLLGCIEDKKGDSDKAYMHLQIAAGQRDASFEHRTAWATFLFKKARYMESLKEFNALLALSPKDPTALTYLSIICCILGELSVAEQCCQQILKSNSRSPETMNNLAAILKEQGKIDEAIDWYRKALLIRPDYTTAGSSLLLALWYTKKKPEDIVDEHKAWYQRLALPASGSPPVYIHHKVDKKIDRPIRIGYLSPDFRGHSVACFAETILRHHDPANYPTFCYADVSGPDKVTERLKSYNVNWLFVNHLSDTELISRIKADAIDILVDLAGHSGDNRLPIFMFRPAPIQITYLGYPGTTGLFCMDYRITDEISDPVGYERYYTENLLRLDPPFLCYTPPIPSDVPLRCTQESNMQQPFTFGCFNTLPKINDETLSLWANILSRTQGSRLFLKTRQFNDTSVCNAFAIRCKNAGINPDRLILSGRSATTRVHLDEYNKVDIALDTLYYNGTTTTVEALFMGVPVVCLAGDRHCGRVGASLLNSCGMQGLLASSKEEYCAIAESWHAKGKSTTTQRQNISGQFLSSSLCNGKNFVSKLEAVYRKIWQRYCEDEA